jgi:hypothetical protein
VNSLLLSWISWNGSRNSSRVEKIAKANCGSFTGSLSGRCDNTDCTGTITKRGPALQVGFGANGKNVGFGTSAWFDVEVDCPDRSTSCDGDFNLDLGVGTGLHFAQGDDEETMVTCPNLFDTTYLRSRVQATNEMTVQVVFSQEATSSSDTRIVSWSNSTSWTTSLTDRQFSVMTDQLQSGMFTHQLRLTTSDTTLNELIPDAWHPDTPTVCAFSYNPQTGEVRSYLNGTLVQTFALTGDFWTTDWENRFLVLGNEATGDRGLEGTLYDVKLWNQVLSDTELLQRADAILTGGAVPGAGR